MRCDRTTFQIIMPTALQTSPALTKEETQQLAHRLSLFPPSDVEAFRAGVLVFPKQNRDRALFDWVMSVQPPDWYASWVLSSVGSNPACDRYPLKTKALALARAS